MELGIAHWNGGGSMLGVDMLTLAEGIWAEGDKLPLLRGALWNVSERPLSLFDPRKRTRSNSRERNIGWWNDVWLSGPTLSQRFGACAFCGERLLGKKELQLVDQLQLLAESLKRKDRKSGGGNPKALPPLDVLFQLLSEEDIDVIDYLQRSSSSQRLKRAVGLRLSIDGSAFEW